MKILGWTFIVLNVVISLAYLRNATRSYNALGRGEIGAPSAWVYVVAANRSSCRHSFRLSPWHLIWWFFPVGFIVAFIAGKIAMRLGYDPFS